MVGTAAERSEGEPAGRRLKALIIDSDDLSLALRNSLEAEGFSVQRAYNQSHARPLLRSLRFDIVVSEMVLPDGDGELVFREALPFLDSTPFIFTASAAHIEQAVRVIKAGAYDYIAKPYDVPALTRTIRDLIDAHRTPIGVVSKKPQMRSGAMALLDEQLKKLADSSVAVLLVGEFGTGKKLMGRRLHQLSARHGEPFVEIHCGGLAGPDADRLLFGEVSAHEGKTQVSIGALEQAGNGSLFLDHLEQLPSSIKTKFVQAIDEKKFHRIGDVTKYLPFKARLISSSDLGVAELRQKIYPDLFYRLAVVELRVPPLQNRQEDIRPLLTDLVQECAAELGVAVLPIDPDVISAARLHEWPGNVREMRTRLLRALSLGNGKSITMADMFPEINVMASATPPTMHLDQARAVAERDQIVQALTATEGRIGKAARQLGISRVTLWMKMKRLGLHHSTELVSETDE